MFRRYLLTVGPDLAKCCRFGLFVKSGQFLAELFSVGQNFEPTLAKKKFAFGVILTVVPYAAELARQLFEFFARSYFAISMMRATVLKY